MDLTLIRAFTIPIDFFMCMFLWIVQLIIYPSFTCIHGSEFHQWHLKYMRTVGLLVGPIMLTQIILTGYVVYADTSYGAFYPCDSNRPSLGLDFTFFNTASQET